MKGYSIAPIKLKISLMIIKDNDLYEAFTLLKEYLGLLPSQLLLYLEELINRGFIYYDLKKGNLELTIDGINYLKNHNLHLIKIEELTNTSITFDSQVHNLV